MTKQSSNPSIARRTEPLAIEYVTIEKLRPNPRNARRHGAKQIAHLAASIELAGFLQAILVNERFEIICGHGRLEAARQLGMKTVPVVVISHLSEDELRVFALADNRIAELATWDEEVLKIEFGELNEADLDFSLADVTGFEAPQIEGIIFGDYFAKSDSADEVLTPPGSGPAIARPGDVFSMGKHRLGCGDARATETLARLMDGQRAALVVADGPYNVRVRDISGKGHTEHREFPMACGEMSRAEFVAFNRDWLRSTASVCVDGALLYGFMDGLHLADLIEGGREAGLSHIAQCVWAKTNAGMGGFYRSQVEHVAVFKSGKGKHTNNIELGRHGRNRSNLWNRPGMNSFGRNRDAALKAHPTVKPVGLIADIILDASRRGDIVLDPFLGSGSTIIAADRTGRRGYGVELDPLYVDAALDRFAAVLGVDPVRVSDGALWSELRAARTPEAG